MRKDVVETLGIVASTQPLPLPGMVLPTFPSQTPSIMVDSQVSIVCRATPGWSWRTYDTDWDHQDSLFFGGLKELYILSVWRSFLYSWSTILVFLSVFGFLFWLLTKKGLSEILHKVSNFYLSSMISGPEWH